MSTLRPYQYELKRAIYTAWQDVTTPNVLGVAPTGAGKTVLFSDILQEHRGASVAIAHRQELVSQISLALARNGVRHRIIGAKTTLKACVAIHFHELGRSYVDPSAPCAVAGVDTLVRMDKRDAWLHQVTLGVQDEAHHMLANNKWGKAASMFPNARWLGVTATPIRADGAGLGRHADGLMDTMVLAPSMRELISMGYLTPYRIFAPPSDIDMHDVPLSAGGDFSPPALSKAVHKSHITGDVVQHYVKHANGKLGITFCVDVAAAVDQATAFKAAGIPAEVVSANTPDLLRANILAKFRKREILQLVNVDLFGEGFDLPAIEVVSMARPTASLNLFVQSFGRGLRLMLDPTIAATWDQYDDEMRRELIAKSNKPYAIILDHVGNTLRHGLPDAPRPWTLDRRDRRARNTADGVIPVRTCPGCALSYERFHTCCPYCGFIPEPAGRSLPEQVDGDLMELTPEALDRLRGDLDAAQTFTVPYGAEPIVVNSQRKFHHERLEARERLRQAVALWCGRHTSQTDEGTMRREQKRFYLRFGIDVLTAQTLNRADSEALLARVEADRT
jgi:superfamily II DNA or RNA helicase